MLSPWIPQAHNNEFKKVAPENTATLSAVPITVGTLIFNKVLNPHAITVINT